MTIEIEDPVGFALEMMEMDDLANKIWELLKAKRPDFPILLPYLNSYEVPFYHQIGVRNDLTEPSMNKDRKRIMELF